MGVKHHDFLNVVKESWKVPLNGNPMNCFAGKLKRLRKRLGEWNKVTFGNLNDKIVQVEAVVLDAELRCQIDESEAALNLLTIAQNHLHNVLE